MHITALNDIRTRLSGSGRVAAADPNATNPNRAAIGTIHDHSPINDVVTMTVSATSLVKWMQYISGHKTSPRDADRHFFKYAYRERFGYRGSFADLIANTDDLLSVPQATYKGLSTEINENAPLLSREFLDRDNKISRNVSS